MLRYFLLHPFFFLTATKVLFYNNKKWFNFSASAWVPECLLELSELDSQNRKSKSESKMGKIWVRTSQWNSGLTGNLSVHFQIHLKACTRTDISWKSGLSTMRDGNYCKKKIRQNVLKGNSVMLGKKRWFLKCGFCSFFKTVFCRI